MREELETFLAQVEAHTGSSVPEFVTVYRVGDTVTRTEKGRLKILSAALV